jgi:hypothetical protein
MAALGAGAVLSRRLLASRAGGQKPPAKPASRQAAGVSAKLLKRVLDEEEREKAGFTPEEGKGVGGR